MFDAKYARSVNITFIYITFFKLTYIRRCNIIYVIKHIYTRKKCVACVCNLVLISESSLFTKRFYQSMRRKRARNRVYARI